MDDWNDVTAERGDEMRRLLRMSGALANASTTEEAFSLLLDGVGGALGCAVAACWRQVEPDGPLVCTAWWQAPWADVDDFRVASQSIRFEPGAGLPGKVWAEGHAIWLEDVASHPELPRLAAARAVGFHGGLAFPILSERRVIAVLDFFSTSPMRRDPDTLRMLDVLGAQIGEFVRRKDTEAALAQTSARFRIFAETASDAIFTTDASSTILYTNPAVERVFGYKPEELLKRNLSVLIPQRMREQHHHGVARYVATGRRNISWSGVQLPGLHKHGHEIPLEISFGEFVLDGQHYFTGIARDVSDRVRQHAEAVAAREEAERANRAKSEFLATMSHELRTPLNAMIGYSDLLLAGVPEELSATVSAKVQRISVSARHLLELIEEILTFSRIEAGEEKVDAAELDVRHVMTEVQALMEPLALAAGLTFRCKGPDEAMTMHSDARKIRQILVNLLGNAVKFTRRGSVSLHASEEGENVVFVVSDTGIGIAPDDQENIFQPFWQVDNSSTRTAEGTGLGLAVTRRLVRLLGGSVTVESAAGSGATFTVALPRTAPVPAE